MIQMIETLQMIGFLILGLGIVLIIAGCVAGQRGASQSHGEVQRESKGMVLIGPIPIVWGFGRRGWLAAGAIGIIILVLWIIGLL
ncbi:MAG: DUF131 domain-containing protein [Candidatus Thorarchaeota archaeon]